MSQLIQIRQRIKAITTIKKITHAMRLVAMSSHAHLKKNQHALTTYVQEIRDLFSNIKQSLPNDSLVKEINQSSRPLLILIGSQKGLCGSFNTQLFSQFNSYIKNRTAMPELIVVGKKAIDFIQQKKIAPLLELPVLTPKNVKEVSLTLSDFIIASHYAEVTIISNEFKNFFIQLPKVTILLPVAQSTNIGLSSEYLWEESPQKIYEQLFVQYIEAQLHYILFQSLLAEQAARFVSMDSATRNAQEILDYSRLQYNKLRQAKITKELTELSGSFQEFTQ